MRFLIRSIFWLGVIAALLPMLTRGPTDGQGAAPPVSAFDAATAASAVVSDMRQFCTRQPDACAVGGRVFAALGQTAQAGARMLYDIVSAQMSGSDGAAPATSVTGATGRPDTARPTTSQNTLTTDDLGPQWRGPTAGIEARRPQG